MAWKGAALVQSCCSAAWEEVSRRLVSAVDACLVSGVWCLVDWLSDIWSTRTEQYVGRIMQRGDAGAVLFLC